MDLYDQHLHSRHSFDSSAEPDENVRAAIDKGLAGLTFTEHFDTHPGDRDSCIYDESAYAETIHGLRKAFGRSIFIGKGIEVCYQPDRMPFVLDFLRRHPFDLVMLSVHYFGDKPVHERDQWAGLDVATGTRRYLETVREAARFCAELHAREGNVFHVLGHLDLVKRYTKRFFDVWAIASCDDLVDDILRACLEADLIPEVNTSTLRQGLDEPMPGADTIKRYVALGGTAVSLGSDAHRAQDIGADFDRVVTMLRGAGVKHLVRYEARERQTVGMDGR